MKNLEHIEELNETLLELRRCREREISLAEENRTILATLSALSNSENKYQIFDELQKVLGQYIDFSDFIVISKQKSELTFTTFLTTNRVFKDRHWRYGNKFQRVLDGECILLFQPDSLAEFSFLGESLRQSIRMALMIGIRAQASDSVLLLLGSENGQFNTDTKSTFLRFRPLIERAISEIEHKETLQSIVDQRTKELQEARQIAEQANETKSQFLAMMSHELRTPLNAVIGIIDILQQGSDDYQSDLLTRMGHSAELLHVIIGDILDVSQIESGHFKLHRQWTNLNERLLGSLEHYQSNAEQKNLTFHISAQVSDQYEYFVDPVRLMQIIFNLVGNAIKFTDEGEVSVELNTVDDQLSIIVADTGIGIKPEKLHHLFTPFIQADSTKTRNYGGTGLGLAITKHLVDLMGGHIYVESRLAKGTTFHVNLPLCLKKTYQVSQPELPPRDSSSHQPLTQKNVLVVEDTKTNQMVIQILLEQMGYSVTIAENGQEFLDIIVKNTDFSLILMDISMPVMDGIEATKRLRHHNILTPVVALTAHSTPEDRDKCLLAGMDDFIVKPFRKHHIQAIVDKYLNENR
ncbi:ATP-binding protein [Vibrio gazogenes]|uniref:histidine kinase n=1 Tax=Vibrio gazogenes DSM 21264 = NBRC 103151 TaxID=1123492 RepID=A0A1M4ZJT1_VIBGA|nr:ATP-binding protein [Vibrio gazogenes]USP15277.1 ATP-binding protein [Vibrio gazogenes]SHF18274.1 Signal transduction histidine kinase [Vibrio gazogenes DSM 21264] [Vibrio gazogenes DSM 21264 = NBRC 103151]SJN54131.1 Autoinducer 2 sensor kinase/phosphatase LuxQ [Vibrio gazogenes]